MANPGPSASNSSQLAVAFITGANTGVGLALAHRLLAEHHTAHGYSIAVVLGCRNPDKATSARAELLAAHPQAQVDLLAIDVSNTRSVLAAAAKFRERYGRLDQLYLNAGIMLADGIDWKATLKPSLAHYVALFNSGSQVMRQSDTVTPEGLQATFATNVFGHYMLVEELVSLMEASARQPYPNVASGLVVFTSSRAAQQSSFTLDNLQHVGGPDPYGSSKRAVDLLIVAFAARATQRNSLLQFVAACPGLVVSQLTAALLAPWLWTCLAPLFWLCRLFAPSLTMSSYNGAEALVALQRQGFTRTPAFKYLSACGPLGRLGVTPVPIDDPRHEAEPLLQALAALRESVRAAPLRE